MEFRREYINPAQSRGYKRASVTITHLRGSQFKVYIPYDKLMASVSPQIFTVVWIISGRTVGALLRRADFNKTSNGVMNARC